jgi:hypothetical protein
VITLVVTVLDEGLDLGLKVTGNEFFFRRDSVFQVLVIALDLALSLRVYRRAAHVVHLGGFNKFSRPRTRLVLFWIVYAGKKALQSCTPMKALTKARAVFDR